MRNAFAFASRSVGAGSGSDQSQVRAASPSTLFFLFALTGIVLIYIYYEFDVRLISWPLEVSRFPAFRDFSNLWVGAVDAINHRFDLLFEEKVHIAEVGRRLGIPPPFLIWSYPPTALVPLLPFGLLPFGIAAALWTAVGVAAYVCAAGLRDVPPRDRVTWLAALALCPGVFVCAAYGQTAFLTSAATIIGLLQANRRPMIAGACFALLAAKPQMALVIPVVLLAMQAWRAIAYSALFASLFVATTIVLFGFEPWKFFVEITLPNQMQIMNMTSFNAVLMSSPYFMLRGFGVSASVSYHLQILIAVAAMAWLYAGLRCERDRNLQIVMVACATLLASAYMRTYEIPLLAAAVARICASEDGAARYGRGLLCGLIISVTAAPLIAWLAALVFKINVMSLIPLVILAILGVRAIFQDAPIAKLSAVVGRDRSENRAPI